MAHSRQVTNSTNDTVKDHVIPKTSTNPTLLSLPLEVRLIIFAACIKRCWVKEDGGLPNYQDEPMWYLSHTIPRSTLRLSKQLRIEAFTALAGYPGLTVICNSLGDCSPKNNAYSSTFGNSRFITENTLQDFGRVYQQCKRLPAPKGRKLTLRLFDKYGYPVFYLEDAKEWLVDHIFVAVELWPKWESVFIDVDAMLGMMMDERGSWDPDRATDIERAWRMIVEELQPLRARTTTMTVGLRWWSDDPVLKELEKGEGSGYL